jgi:hypothetical protein
MTNPNEFGSSAAPQGSPNNSAENVPANGNAGETKPTEETVPKTQYQELETKLGTQGEELGDYRKFFEEITPVLEILQKDPELTQAIVDGKVSSDLLKSLEKGDITKPQAEEITKAHEDVKKELGKEGYQAASKEEIESLVSSRLQEKSKEIDESVNKRILESEEKRDFQDYITEFINSTPDFPEVSDLVRKWFDEHPEQTDIKVAYDAVKKGVLEERYKKEEESRNAEAAKDVALNAGGGSGQQTGKIEDTALVDKLIGRVSNPNIF